VTGQDYLLEELSVKTRQIADLVETRDRLVREIQVRDDRMSVMEGLLTEKQQLKYLDQVTPINYTQH